MADQLLKVTRAFYLGGTRREVGDVFPVDAKLALDLRGLRKAEFTTQPAKPAAKAAPKES